MLIGIDASRANRARKTGTEWYSFYLIENFAKQDKINQYHLYLDREPREDLKKAVVDNPNFSFKVLRWPWNFFWTLGRLSLEMLIHRPDVLFIPAHTMPLFYPKRTVMTIHDVAFAREDRLYRNEGARTDGPFFRKIINFFVKILTRGKYQANSLDYLDWSTRFALKRAQKIITVSEFTKKEILELYPFAQADKITAVHNGFPKHDFFPIARSEKTQEVLSRYGIEEPFFLYVGRLERKKNTPMLVESLAMFKEQHPETREKLVLIGDAGFGFDEVKYSIEQFNLGNQIVMTGWVKEADLPIIFNAAVAFVFPSRHEGFGIPVVQAMACGLPVIASGIPVLREIAGDAALYFDTNDKDGLTAALWRVSTDENLRQELRVKGMERAAGFSWEKCAQETFAIIEAK